MEYSWFRRRQWQPIPVLLPGKSMDRGAWWVAIYGVTQSQTQLKWFGSSSSIVDLQWCVSFRWTTKLISYAYIYIYIYVYIYIYICMYVFLFHFHILFPYRLLQNTEYSSLCFIVAFSVSSLLSHVQFLATPWTAAHQASLSITNSQSLLKLMSIELVMPYNHLILCHPLLPLPSISHSIRAFSNESVLRISSV